MNEILPVPVTDLPDYVTERGELLCVAPAGVSSLDPVTGAWIDPPICGRPATHVAVGDVVNSHRVVIGTIWCAECVEHDRSFDPYTWAPLAYSDQFEDPS